VFQEPLERLISCSNGVNIGKACRTYPSLVSIGLNYEF